MSIYTRRGYLRVMTEEHRDLPLFRVGKYPHPFLVDNLGFEVPAHEPVEPQVSRRRDKVTEVKGFLATRQKPDHLVASCMPARPLDKNSRRDFLVTIAVSYTHLRAHETRHDLVCRLLLEK